MVRVTLARIKALMVDIVVRQIFAIIKALTEDIVVRQIFGAVQGFVWRIEWQARGLPHVHLLVIFGSNH